MYPVTDLDAQRCPLIFEPEIQWNCIKQRRNTYLRELRNQEVWALSCATFPLGFGSCRSSPEVWVYSTCRIHWSRLFWRFQIILHYEIAEQQDRFGTIPYLSWGAISKVFHLLLSGPVVNSNFPTNDYNFYILPHWYDNEMARLFIAWRILNS